MPAPDIFLAQVTMSAFGGLIGGLSGFVANGLQDRRNRNTTMRHVAQAISGEIEALAQSISANDYFQEIRAATDLTSAFVKYKYHLIRGEQEYMPVFHSLGINIGALPAPLPKDLVIWYTRLSICIERSRAFGEIGKENVEFVDERVAKTMQVQFIELCNLIDAAKDLRTRLSLVANRRWQ